MGDWCDLCGDTHRPQDGPGYDLDGWAPSSLAEVLDAMLHARSVRVLSSTNHYALDKLLVHTVRLLTYAEHCPLADTALAGQILSLYSDNPKWYG